MSKEEIEDWRILLADNYDSILSNPQLTEAGWNLAAEVWHKIEACDIILRGK